MGTYTHAPRYKEDIPRQRLTIQKKKKREEKSPTDSPYCLSGRILGHHHSRGTTYLPTYNTCCTVAVAILREFDKDPGFPVSEMEGLRGPYEAYERSLSVGETIYLGNIPT